MGSDGHHMSKVQRKKPVHGETGPKVSTQSKTEDSWEQETAEARGKGQMREGVAGYQNPWAGNCPMHTQHAALEEYMEPQQQ